MVIHIGKFLTVQIHLDFCKLRDMNQYKLLVDSLKLLGLSYNEQKSFLPDFVGDNIQDDVVSEFDNAFRLLPQLMDDNKLSYLAVNKILSCFIAMDMNISNTDLTDESFKSGESWERVRELAREALEEMGESLVAPENIILID